MSDPVVVVICESKDTAQWSRISFGYSTQVVAIIQALPVDHRRFVGEDKMWRIHQDSIYRLQATLEALGHQFAVIPWKRPEEDQ